MRTHNLIPHFRAFSKHFSAHSSVLKYLILLSNIKLYHRREITIKRVQFKVLSLSKVRTIKFQWLVIFSLLKSLWFFVPFQYLKLLKKVSHKRQTRGAEDNNWRGKSKSKSTLVSKQSTSHLKIIVGNDNLRIENCFAKTLKKMLISLD